MPHSRISGHKEHQRTRNGQIIILSFDYAQVVTIQENRKGQMMILSYDFFRISGYEFSEKIILLSYDYAQNVRVQQHQTGPKDNT